MIILFVKSQSFLFDAPVNVDAHVRTDGTLVAAHTRIQKVALHQASKLDAFITKQGGHAMLARKLSHLTDGQRETMFAKMAELDRKKTASEIAAMFHLEAAPAAPQKDLFEQPAAEEAKPDVKPEPAPAPVPAEEYRERSQTVERFGPPVGATKAQRREINEHVANLVQTAGPVDKPLMAQYSGNGGCGDSLNEFYTDPAVAKAQWDVIQRIGQASGTALEPSCATGVYMHTAPEGFRVTGVELDPISSACAVALHGDRHEIVGSTSLERFARSDGGRQFPVVIGNPPYGPRGSLAKDDKPDLKTAESYFIDTAIDKCQPGGIVSLVVPASVLNSKNGRRFRERMLRKAEFLGAQRMPNTAFEASHTDVTADVIWLRKRGDDVAGAMMTVDQKTMKKLGVWDEEFLAGTYFDGRGADNLLGQAGTAMRAYGEVYTVNGSMVGVPETIAAFEPHPVGNNPTVSEIVDALDTDKEKARTMGAAMIRPYADGKAGDTKVVDGVTYVLQGKPLRWHRVDEILAHEAVADAKPLADKIDRLVNGDGDDREGLEDAVNAYIARHGIPAKSKHLVEAAEHDAKLYRLIGAVDHTGRLSDTVTGRQANIIAGSLETAAATLAAEKDTGDFSAAELALRTGKDIDEVRDILTASSAYAYTVEDHWMPMDQYLTGNLWLKVDAAKSAKQPAELADKLAMQVKRLEEAIGPKTLDDVDFGLNSGFIPPAMIAAWMDSEVEALRASDPKSTYYQELRDAKVEFEKGLYRISGGAWGHADMLATYLNRTGTRKDDMPKIERMNEEFRTWLLTSQYRDEIEELYNRKFRGFIAPKFSKEAIDVPGLDTDGGKRLPNDYHWDSLRWALGAGKGIIADDVGLGKTLRGLMLARLAKMYGKATKPTFVVPKSVLANWVSEANLWFPGSRILVIGETYSRDKEGNLKSRPDNEAERNRKYHDLSQNDYDFVFINRDSFNELDVDPITKGEYLDQDFWVQRGDALGNAGDKKVKRVREQHAQAVSDREFGKRTDAIYFNHLGIDMMIVDEGHAYKNLYAARARFGESPKFLGGQGQSNRAFDMSFKAKWLRENNGGKGVYALTATPSKNSPLEIYSMLSYVAPEEFEKIGIRNSEEFLDRYCVFKTESLLQTNGEIAEGLATVGFKNLDELREIMNRYIMRRTAGEVGLQIPTAKQEMHLVDMTPQQSAVYGELRAALGEVGKKDASGDAHVFSIMDKMAKAALDLELLDKDAHAGAVSPKYDEVATVAAAASRDGGQVIFCEAVDAHEKIARALVAKGIPRDRIAILNANEAANSAKRQNISDRFNAGKLDVVIGNKIMEEGINLQKKTSDIHHLDTPWDPATLQQRNGRGVRQGNKRESVRVHTYLARGSFDGYRYQSMRAKKDWQEMLWNGGDRVDNLAREGVFSREDMMIMMSADPEAERAKLASDKDAAMQRLKAERTVKAAGEFVKFQSLKRSFNGLGNKDTKSAMRLRAQIDSMKTGLLHNKYFQAKAALDSNTDVVINPATGDMINRDMGIEVDESAGGTSRWVVTGVNAVENTVSMRRYADTTGHKGVTVPIKRLEAGTRTFEFDASAEADAVGKEMEEAAMANLNSLKDYDQVRRMPSAVLEQHADLIQRQMKEGAKAHTFKFPYGDIHMVNRATGKVETFPSYSHNDKHETHDYFLPTEANKEKAVQAWIDARRGAELGTKYTPGRRKNQQGTSEPARVYEGASHDSKHRNPFSTLLDRLSGKESSYGATSELVKQAKARLETEQLERIHRAKTFAEALDAAAALATPVKGTGDSDKALYPRRALMLLWAKAKRLGVLDTPAQVHPYKKLGPYGGRKHSDYAYGGSSALGKSTQTMLEAMANQSRHKDLALAMVQSHRRAGLQRPARETYDSLDAIADMGHDATAAAALRLANDVAVTGGFAENSYGGNRNTYGYDPHRYKTIRARLAERLAEVERVMANTKEPA